MKPQPQQISSLYAIANLNCLRPSYKPKQAKQIDGDLKLITALVKVTCHFLGQIYPNVEKSTADQQLWRILCLCFPRP